ncbi:hypothetical protein Tco_0477863 [Tanacetum coccineum]
MKSCRSGVLRDGDEDEDENDDKRLCLFGGEAMRVLKARIVKEVEANQKRIKKELEKQDVLRRKGKFVYLQPWRIYPLFSIVYLSELHFCIYIQALIFSFSLDERAEITVKCPKCGNLGHIRALLGEQCLPMKQLTPSLMDVRIFVKVLAWRWRWLWLAATKADTRVKRKEFKPADRENGENVTVAENTRMNVDFQLPKTTITKKKLAESQVHVESKEIAGHYILHVHEYPEKLTLTYKPEEDIESAESE